MEKVAAALGRGPPTLIVSGMYVFDAQWQGVQEVSLRMRGLCAAAAALSPPPAPAPDAHGTAVRGGRRPLAPTPSAHGTAAHGPAVPAGTAV